MFRFLERLIEGMRWNKAVAERMARHFVVAALRARWEDDVSRGDSWDCLPRRSFRSALNFLFLFVSRKKEKEKEFGTKFPFISFLQPCDLSGPTRDTIFYFRP